jgi:hypothetical protein
VIVFHRVLIGTAIVFSGGFAWWMLARYRADGGAASLALGAGSLLAAVALGYYLKNLRRFLHR